MAQDDPYQKLDSLINDLDIQVNMVGNHRRIMDAADRVFNEIMEIYSDLVENAQSIKDLQKAKRILNEIKRIRTNGYRLSDLNQLKDSLK